MSAAVVILPRIWATASVAAAAEAVSERKGPQSVRMLQAAEMQAPEASVRLRPVPELAFYRKYTEAMLRRYMKLSMEAGRVPSMLGQEMFRGKVTSCKVHSFEDVVNFVHDVGNCVAKLDKGQQHLIRRIALEEYTQGEAAAMLGMSLRTVIRRYTEALDRLTRMLLERKMLEPLTACEEEGG